MGLALSYSSSTEPPSWVVTVRCGSATEEACSFVTATCWMFVQATLVLSPQASVPAGAGATWVVPSLVVILNLPGSP